MKKIEIDQRSDDSAYISMGDWVVYIDNSTGEKIIDSWTKGEEYDTQTKKES